MDLQREKILNALHYFSADTLAFASRVKLMKLFYFMDFIHYRERGRSITGLEYYAWDFGPMPRLLWNEWMQPKPDFRTRFKVVEQDFPIGRDLTLEIQGQLDQSVFSNSEWDLIVQLALEHFRDTPEEMVDSKHFEVGPWDLIWGARKHEFQLIPYDAVFGTDNKNEDRERRNYSFEKFSMENRYG